MSSITDNIPKSERKSNENNHDQMLRAAIAYASILQWHVFPVHSVMEGKCTCLKPACPDIGKHPRTGNGFKDATTNLETIKKWWTSFPNANIGVRTGKESGLFVLDVNVRGKNGMRTLERLVAENSALPDTTAAISGSGGRHYFFKYQDGVGNKVEFQPGLDIKGDGGYIIVNPSIHGNGNRYEWEITINSEIADAPKWLVDMLKQPSNRQGVSPQSRPSSHWQKLMQGLNEHDGRNSAAASIVGHLLSRKVDMNIVYELMHLWNQRNNPPLSKVELDSVIISIGRKVLEGRGA